MSQFCDKQIGKFPGGISQSSETPEEVKNEHTSRLVLSS